MGRRSFDALTELIARLRADSGCPWDKVQDHYSLRPYMLEEVHEAIAAIDAGDPESLAEELGDLLLQILLHSQIAAEEGQFSIDDVVDRLSRKIIRRHPHVFGEETGAGIDDVRGIWEDVKTREKKTDYPLPTILVARKLVECLPQREIRIEEVAFPSQEEEAGGNILIAIASA